MPRTDPALEEAGLSEEVVAGSIARVFGLMLGQEEPVGEDVGWSAVVRTASAIFGGEDESDVEVPLHKIADVFRESYGRAIDPDYQPDAQLSESARLGWQAVTRHLLNVFSMDSKEARFIERHEAQVVAFVKSRSATPK